MIFNSIRRTIPVLVITPLLVGLTVTTWLAFQSGQKGVRQLAGNLSDRITDSIEDNLEAYLTRPILVSEISVTNLETGGIDLENFEVLQEFFWQNIQKSPAISTLHYGDRNGNFIKVSENAEGRGELAIRDSTTGLRSITYTLNDRGQREQELGSQEYDPRQRAWYQRTVEEQEPTWSPVYSFAKTGSLGITNTYPIYENDGLQGVLGVDVSLKEISDFLQGLEISENGVAFVIERSGDLVASSTAESPMIEAGDRSERLNFLESQETAIQNTAESLITELENGNLDRIQEMQTFVFEYQNQRQLVQVSPFGENLGLDWLIVVVIPEADFMDYIYAQTRRTIIVMVIIGAIAIALGILISRWITRPMIRLNHAAKNVEDMSFDPATIQDITARQDEVGELAKVFEDMAIAIGAREQSLADQIAALQDQNSQIQKSRTHVKSDEMAYLQALQRKAQDVREKNQKALN